MRYIVREYILFYFRLNDVIFQLRICFCIKKKFKKTSRKTDSESNVNVDHNMYVGTMRSYILLLHTQPLEHK